MKTLANLLVVLGVCAGALGASGFHVPFGTEDMEREPLALTIYAVGFVSLVVGGFLLRTERRAGADGEAAIAERQETLERMLAIQRVVVALDENRRRLAGRELQARITKLFAEDYFDLTSKNDQLITVLGTSAHARVWEGVATAERLLARAWSMCTDGHVDEGREELPHARRAFDAAVRAMRSL